MRGIFIRIYIAFIVTSLVATLVTVALAVYYRQWSTSSVNLIAPTGGYISAAELMLQRGGEPLLLDWLLTFDRHPSVNAYVFDSQGNSLTKDISTVVEEYAFAADSYQARVNPLGQAEVLVKAPIEDYQGNIYLLVVEFIHPLAVFNLPTYLAWGLLASILIFAAWGFILSRYFTLPLLSLQRSVRRFAKGNWPVLYSPKVLARQDEIGELGRVLEQMSDQIQRMVTDQRVLLSDVSHELRSPLARISVALELAKMDMQPEQQEFIERIELEAARLNELIEDLLNIARLDTLPKGQQKDLINLGDLLARIVEDARFEHANSLLELSVPGKPVIILGESKLLSSALENIIRNALLHNLQGMSVEVTLLEKVAGGVQVTVRDHGPGVPEERLQDLLKPFVRTEQARERSLDSLTKGHRGFGLGLAIAHRVIQFHAGRIELQNHPKGGLEVSVYLPNKAD